MDFRHHWNQFLLYYTDKPHSQLKSEPIEATKLTGGNSRFAVGAGVVICVTGHPVGAGFALIEVAAKVQSCGLCTQPGPLHLTPIGQKQLALVVPFVAKPLLEELNLLVDHWLALQNLEDPSHSLLADIARHCHGIG